MNKILASSVNPEKLSLTIKGVILAAVSVAITITGITHLNLGQTDITALGDSLINLVNIALQLVSAAFVVWGLLRKIGVALGVVKKAQ